MAMGKRTARQELLFIAADRLPQSDGHPFYKKLNALLAEAQFDRWLENAVRRTTPRTNAAASRRFRRAFTSACSLIGYFEGIDSQRGIAWRCADSRRLGEFLGVPRQEPTPDHSTLSRTRGRLPFEVHDAMFQFVLTMAGEKKLLRARRWPSIRRRSRPTRP